MQKLNKDSVCTVIVSYEPDNAIIKLYNSVKEQVDKIIIVDNNSQSVNSKNILKLLNKDIDVIYNDKNYGIAKALNQGAEYAVNNQYKWLLTLDQDSEFIRGGYSLILKAYHNLKDKDKIMIIAPKPVESILAEEHKFDLPDINNIIWKDVIINLTSGSLIKTEAFNKIGLFEEKLFIEQVDNEFCYRLKKYGFKIKIAENIKFIHRIGNAQKKLFFITRNHNPQRKYYLARNSVYVLKKYFIYSPYTTLRVFLGATILGWFKILLFEDNKLKKITYGVKGLIDGIFYKY